LFIIAAFWQEPASPSSRSLVELILRASPIAKLVLLILLIFSIASWAIIIAKSFATRRAQRQSAEFLKLFARSARWSELQAASAAFGESPLAAICQAVHEELRAQGSALAGSGPHGRRAPLNLEALSRVMQSVAIAETTRLERSLGWLASTASASPFIGLFGTVIGIIIAFQGLSQAASASIQAVAPGIAEALVATAAGIAAAVPAVLAYNHYLNRIKVLAAEMDSFALRLLNFVEREDLPGHAAPIRASEIIPLGQHE
jgi:biopolymer transport protein TolQ